MASPVHQQWKEGMKKEGEKKTWQPSFYLTQVLSNYGCLRSFLHKMRKVKQDERAYCEKPLRLNTRFLRWEVQRSQIDIEFGHTLTSEVIVEKILGNDVAWTVIQNFVKDVLKRKERGEMLTQDAWTYWRNRKLKKVSNGP